MKMSIKLQPRKIKSILLLTCWILTLLQISSCNSNRNTSNEKNISIQQIFDGLLLERDATYYDELFLRADECLWDDFVSASLFAGDSLGYLLAYGMMADYAGEKESEIFYAAILLLHGHQAYYDFFRDAFPINSNVKQWIKRDNYKMGLEDAQNIDSLLSLMKAVEDDSSYMAFRTEIPYRELSLVAKSLADEKGIASAACDVYLSLINSRYGYLAETATADTALRYLEYSANCQFLPAVFYKSLLLLTGTYLPQDTIAGRELFLRCIDSTNCIPFWRGKMIYHTIGE